MKEGTERGKEDSNAKCPLRLGHQLARLGLGSDGASLQEAGPCGRKGGHWHVLEKGALGPTPSSLLLLSHEFHNRPKQMAGPSGHQPKTLVHTSKTSFLLQTDCLRCFATVMK